MYNIAKADGTLLLPKWVSQRKHARAWFMSTTDHIGARIVTEMEWHILRAQIILDKALYRLGKLPPRYPMPAIIYDVYHQGGLNSSTAIWERTGTQYAYNKRVYTHYAT